MLQYGFEFKTTTTNMRSQFIKTLKYGQYSSCVVENKYKPLSHFFNHGKAYSIERVGIATCCQYNENFYTGNLSIEDEYIIVYFNTKWLYRFSSLEVKVPDNKVFKKIYFRKNIMQILFYTPLAMQLDRV
jgi:hypothetical protein